MTENKRKYELTLYSEDFDIGIIYNENISNILEEKVELLSEYMKSPIIYVTRITNEETNGQYPEHMMCIQQAQGYCFYLNLNAKSLYEEVKAKVSIYEKTHRGLWRAIEVCEGLLDDFGLSPDRLLVYKGKLVSELVDKIRKEFQTEQENELEQIKKQEEEERLRQERARELLEERERQRIERAWKEKEERERLEEKIRIQREQKEKREKEERRRHLEEERKAFLKKYPKTARVYELLKELQCLKGDFSSDQGNGSIKRCNIEIQIDNIKINPDRHRIEVYQNSWDKVFIYILEGELSKNFRRPRTGVPYQVLDYTRIDDVENYFRTAFTCIFKPKDSAVECSASEINCQFLTNGNMCVCESSCTYQIR